MRFGFVKWIVLSLPCLGLSGCQATGDVTHPSLIDTVADEATIAQRRQNLGLDASAFAALIELDDLCWYMRFEKNLFTSAAPVSLNCKRMTDGVSHIAVFVEGKTLSEAVQRALERVKQTPGGKGEGLLNRLTLPAAVETMDRLNEKCWNLILEKNGNWLFVGKARMSDELVTRTARAEGFEVNSVLSDALRQLDARQ
jgi:hypothetical protein